ncbi:MAG: hypothetical protein ABIK38_00160 [candidate division WOR-3 bacterium]
MKFKILSPEEVWRRDAKAVFAIATPLSFRSPIDQVIAGNFLDKVFGGNLHHKISFKSRAVIELDCHRCNIRRFRKNGACRAHKGIAWGVLEIVFGVNLCLVTSDNKCRLIFKLNPDRQHRGRK